MKKRNIVLLSIIMNSLFSCVVTDFLNSSSTHHDDKQNSTEKNYVQWYENSPKLIEMEIFPEKRRKRKLGFEKKFNINDLDGDGFVNSEDPYPLDSSYPDIMITGIGNGFSKVKSKYNNKNRNIHHGESIFNMYQFNKDLSPATRTIEPDNYDPEYDGYTKIELDAGASKTIYYSIPKKNIFKDTHSNSYMSISTSASSYDIDINYHGDDLHGFNRIEIIENTVSITIVNNSKGSGSLKIKLEVDYYPEAFKGFTDELDWSSYDTGNTLFINENTLNISLLNVKTDEYNYDDNFYNTSDSEDFLKKISEKITQIMGKFNNSLNSSSISLNDDLDKDITLLLTGDETQGLLDLIEFGNDSHVKLDSTYFNFLNLPANEDSWKALPYETLLIGSVYKGVDTFGKMPLEGSNPDVLELDNIVMSNPGNLPVEPGQSNPTEMKLTFPVHHGLNLEKAIVLKLVLTRKGDLARNIVSYDHRLFINFGEGLKKTWHIHPFANKYRLDMHGLKEAGFTTGNNYISYNLTDDGSERVLGKLPKMIYTTRDNDSSVTEQDSYVMFYYFIPYENDRNKWFSLGTTVHFWGPPARDTLVAKYSNGKITDVKLIPYEHLLDPDYNIENIYEENSLFYKNPFVMERNDKLIILQGSIILPDPVITKLTMEANGGDITEIPVVNNDVAVMDEINANKKLSAFKAAYNPSITVVHFNSITKVYRNKDFNLLLTQDNYNTDENGKGVIGQIPIIINNTNLYSELITDINTDNISYLIPNTRETSDSFTIDARVRSNADNSILSADLDYIRFESPIDRNWADDPIVNSNVRENKGSGFQIYADFNGVKELITTFNIIPGRTDANTDSYTVVNNYEHKYNLNVKSGKVTYKRADNTITTRFCIKPMGTVRPGDDIILRFKSSNYGHVLTDTLPNEDFFAVYDKKMLWRANLYIDEGDNYTPLTAIDSSKNYTDWNNRNPWINGNEWNRVHDGITGDTINFNYNTISQLPAGNGGQTVRLAPFTWHRHKINIPGNKINNSVSYSVGSQDDPFSYNKHMLAQEQDTTPEIWENYISNVHIPGYSSYLWKVMSRIRKRVYEQPIANININKIQPITDILLENCEPADVNERIEFYENQLTPEEAQVTLIDDHYGLTWWYESAQSAGVDCVGLIYRAAAYTGNNYNIANLPTMNWINSPNPKPGNKSHEPDEVWQYLTVGGVSRIFITIDNQPLLWKVASHSDSLEKLKNVVPGDIMYFSSDYHVTMVLSIDSPDEEISKTEIKLIEATWNANSGKIFNSKKLESYGKRNWIIGRLITN